jgi:murein DD-endopeptidase MepM/ murein hydrolase activator NlpD
MYITIILLFTYYVNIPIRGDICYTVILRKQTHLPQYSPKAYLSYRTQRNKNPYILVHKHNTQIQISLYSALQWLQKKAAFTLSALFLCTICLSAVTPESARAGIFDPLTGFFASITSGTSTSEEAPEINLQTVSLRKAGATAVTQEAVVDKTGALAVSSGPLRISTEEEVYIPEDDTISIYVVKKGDTLNSIAKLFGVSVNTIVWSNNLTARKAEVGQTLSILPVSGISHTIKKGDTLKQIAKKYNADEGDVALFNGITTETSLVIGEVLIVPDGEVVAESEKAKTEKTKDSKDNKKTVGNTIKKVVKNLTKSGYFMRPIAGGTRTTGLHGHNAVDLAAPVGTSIVASASGKVIINKEGGYNGGYGNYIVIAHSNGTQTLYAHNSDNLVQVGESVVQGQVIGRVGSTGKSTGPHVHFEVRGAANPF